MPTRDEDMPYQHEELDLLADYVVGILDEYCREAVREAVGINGVMAACRISPPWGDFDESDVAQIDGLRDSVLGHIAKRWEGFREMERRLQSEAVYRDEEELD